MFGLKDLAGISVPLNTLVERVSGAVGFTFGPWVEWANSWPKAQARIRDAKSKEEATDIAWRAQSRRDYIGERQQQCLEAALYLSFPHVREDARPEEIDDDWLVNFLSKAQQFSSIQMQELWGRILAGEANSPGRFSRQSVNILSNIDKRDADAFSAITQFASSGEMADPLIFSTTDEIYISNGVTFESIKNLESLGLVSYHSVAFCWTKPPSFTSMAIEYHKEMYFLEYVSGGRVNAGQVFFTRAGRELSSICSQQEIPGFKQYLTEKWRPELSAFSARPENLARQNPTSSAIDAEIKVI